MDTGVHPTKSDPRTFAVRIRCSALNIMVWRLQRAPEQVIICSLIKVLPSVYLVQVLSSGWVVNTKRWADAHFFFGEPF